MAFLLCTARVRQCDHVETAHHIFWSAHNSYDRSGSEAAFVRIYSHSVAPFRRVAGFTLTLASRGNYVRTRIFASFLILASTATTARAADGWTDVIASSGKTEYTVKIDSFEVAKTKGGDEVASVIGRARDIMDKTIAVEKWYVKTYDCGKGYGKLVTLTVSGDYKYENSFVENDGSVGGAIADLICDVHNGMKEDAEERSI